MANCDFLGWGFLAGSASWAPVNVGVCRHENPQARFWVFYRNVHEYNTYAVLKDTGTGAWNERTPSWIVGKPQALGQEHIVVPSLDGSITILARADGNVAARLETKGSLRHRADYMWSLDELTGLYDRQVEAMHGITGRIAVQDGRIHCATAGGEVAAFIEEENQNEADIQSTTPIAGPVERGGCDDGRYNAPD